jgi:hypothetical protein
MAKLTMRELLRLLPLTPVLRPDLHRMPSLLPQTQYPYHQLKAGFPRFLLQMNVKPDHRHARISYVEQLRKIGHPLGRLPIFLLALKYLFHTFTPTVTFLRVPVAVEMDGQSILPTILVGLVTTLATTAEA